LAQCVEQCRQLEGRRGGALATGFDDLDRVIGGLHPGSLILLLGLESIGKTQLLLTLLNHVCVHNGTPAAMLTSQSTGNQVALALARQMAGPPNTNDAPSLDSAMTAIAQARLYIYELLGYFNFTLLEQCREHVRLHGIRLIVVDGIMGDTPQQLACCGAHSLERQLISLLRRIADELQVTIIASWRLRKADAHPFRISLPEEDAALADVVLLLDHWDHGLQINKDHTSDPKAELIVARNRYGPTGTVPHEFKAGRYGNPTPPAHN
jgi:replicative DNA helicase